MSATENPTAMANRESGDSFDMHYLAHWCRPHHHQQQQQHDKCRPAPPSPAARINLFALPKSGYILVVFLCVQCIFVKSIAYTQHGRHSLTNHIHQEKETTLTLTSSMFSILCALQKRAFSPSQPKVGWRTHPSSDSHRGCCSLQQTRHRSNNKLEGVTQLKLSAAGLLSARTWGQRRPQVF